MLYHVSPTSGLKTLLPHTSTHGKKYVYATENMATGLLFGAKKDDFDFLIYQNENEVPVVFECYPKALEKVYGGRACSVYLVDDNGFLRNQTQWSAELVSENEVSVLEEKLVPDILEQLLVEEQNGNLIIRWYEFNNEYRSIIASHIIDCFIHFDINLDEATEKDSRFAEYYSDLILALKKAMDGSLLK